MSARTAASLKRGLKAAIAALFAITPVFLARPDIVPPWVVGYVTFATATLLAAEKAWNWYTMDFVPEEWADIDFKQ